MAFINFMLAACEMMRRSLFVLMEITFVLTCLSMPKAEDVMYLSVGTLLGVLKGEGPGESKEEKKD